MKHNDAASHHAKRPNTARRTSHQHHAAAHHATKKVFDVMRPGKTPASPTSRPVIMGHKPSAQKSQIAISGIGQAAPVAAVEKPAIDAKKLIQSEELDHAAQVAAAASASLASGLTDPEDMPAGAPPVAIDETPALAVAPSMDSSSSESASEAKVETPEPVMPEPASAVPQPVPESVPEPPKGAPSIDPSATHAITHGKTILPPSQQSQTPEVPQVPTPVPTAPTPDSVPSPTLDPKPFSTIPSAPLPSAINKPPDAPAPAVELRPNDIQDIVVSHHATSVWWHATLLIVLVIILGAIAINIMLDAEIITIPGVPYTDFF